MTIAKQLIERANALIPTLRSRTDEADRAGHLHDRTIQELVDSELVKTMVPRAFGGFEQDWIVFSQILEALGRGCGSTGWVMNAYLCTTYLVATFPERAQREVFGDKGYTLGPCPMNPRLGKARKVDSGYQVTLTAPFGSGVYHSDWAVLCAMTEEKSPEAKPVPLVMLIPRKDYQFDLKSWAVFGMRGTGSATITVKDAFVPDYLVMDLNVLSNRNAPGTLINTAPMYKVPYISAFVLAAVGMIVGMARRGQEALEETLISKVYGMSGQARGSSTASQMKLGEVAAHINAASALVEADLQRMMAGTADHTLTIDERARFRADAAYCALLCRRAIEAAKDAAGASCLRDGNPIQNAFRDINMIGGSFAYNLERTTEIAGRVRLKLPIDEDEV